MNAYPSAFHALNVAVLSDQAKGDKGKIERLKRSEILKSGHFYTMADFMGRDEGDIEDIFEPDLFATILNGAYGLKDANELTAKKLISADETPERLLKKAEAAFRVMPPDVQEFDHFTPAAWLIRNPKVLDGKSAEVIKTLERAETVIEAYNKLL